MGKVVENQNDDYSKKRAGIPILPVNNIPPIPEGSHPYMPWKFNDADGIIQDPWGDASTDFKMMPGLGKPAFVTGSVAMGTQKVLQWTTNPTPRQGFKQTLSYPIKKFSFHYAYTVNSVTGGSGNRCIFSFVDKNLTKFFCLYCTSSTEGPARISTGFGNVNPLGVQTIIPTNYDMTYTLAANVKERISVCYDGTVNGGTFYVYRNGVLINTFPNVGVFTLEGDAYLGMDVRSSTNSSDFKGELGYFILDEYLRTADEIQPIHTFLNKAFI